MKVRIYQNQIVPENSDLYVLSPTGDYGPFDLIQCFKKDNRTLACCALQAQFIKFGGVVYRESEYIDVLGRLGLVDLKPETLNDMLTGDKTSIVVDKDPLANLPDVTFAEDPVDLPNQSIIDNTTTITDPLASSTNQIITPDATSSPLLPETPAQDIVPDATSSPSLPLETVIDMATTTTDTAIPLTVSTSTESLTVEVIQ